MSWTRGELKVSEEIGTGAQSTVADTHTPSASVKELWICSAEGESLGTPNSVVKVVWKWNHATEDEVILWATKHSSFLREEIEVPSDEIDGQRTLAVVCENGEDGNAVMFAHLHYAEKS